MGLGGGINYLDKGLLGVKVLEMQNIFKILFINNECLNPSHKNTQIYIKMT